MDSSNADKAWNIYTGSANPSEVPASWQAFMAAWNARDAEVSELTRLLAESRARFGDSEARRAELEAVIEKVVGASSFHDSTLGWVIRRDDIDLVPSVVLEDRDRENRAIGWDEGERHESDYLSEWGQFCPGEHCNPYRGDTR